MCGRQSENPFVCFGVKPTQIASARDLSRDWKDEGRKVLEKTEEKSRLERVVKRRSQRRQRELVDKGEQMEAVRR